MLRLLAAFTTYDIHTAEITERIASALRENNCALAVRDLAHIRPECFIGELPRSDRWWWTATQRQASACQIRRAELRCFEVAEAWRYPPYITLIE